MTETLEFISNVTSSDQPSLTIIYKVVFPSTHSHLYHSVYFLYGNWHNMKLLCFCFLIVTKYLLVKMFICPLFALFSFELLSLSRHNTIMLGKARVFAFYYCISDYDSLVALNIYLLTHSFIGQEFSHSVAEFLAQGLTG